MTRLSPALALAILASAAWNPPATAAEPAPVTLEDIPPVGLFWDDYKVAPFIAVAAKIQAFGDDKARKLLLELADVEKRVAAHEVRLRADGVTGEKLETAVAHTRHDEYRRREGLFILCRMLFAAKAKEEFRSPLIGLPVFVGRMGIRDCPTEPVDVIDGVPFLVVRGYELAGPRERPDSYVKYCVNNCAWGGTRYAAKTPAEYQAALEKLLARPALQALKDSDRILLASQLDREDVLVADFEGDTYGDGWKTTGTAFGKGPAKGTLKGQMPVSGFLGKGLVNSFLGGDDSTGTLTSLAFTIERRYINFLVGGGKHPNLHIDLIIDGKIVHTAAGPNDKPGGSEHLDWHTWDVAGFQGKKATIEIVDEQKGGWGHINVDHIVQSDTRKQAEVMTVTLEVAKPYLHLPVKNGAPNRRLKFLVGGATVREFDIELATDGKPDFRATADVSAFKGKKLTVEATLPADAKLASLVVPADTWADADKLYQEKHRPLFHFTSRTGWLNDPNGLVYADGTWHLFYQHNPFGREWGNMHWGHATSPDLFRWKEQPIALYPKKYGDWAFSGSAVLDRDNTSGFGTKEKPPLVLAYTSTGRGECIAFSADGGASWREYDQNPVVKHAGRDPKLIWHAGAKHWVMAVYDEHDKKQWIAFYISRDLKVWDFASRIEGFFECPDLFPLTDEYDKARTTKWVLYGADGKYLLGDFDGKEYKPDFKDKKQLWYGNFYAAQTFDNAPQRQERAACMACGRIQIGWARDVTFPGTPFNQQMTVPVELKLNSYPGERVLFAEPPLSLTTLRVSPPAYELSEKERREFRRVKEAVKLADDLDAFDVDLVVGQPGEATGFTLDLRGTPLVYDAKKNTLTCKGVSAPLPARDEAIGLRLRVLVDRGSVEVFAERGRVALSVAALPAERNRTLRLVPAGGEVTIRSATVYRLKSAWEK